MEENKRLPLALKTLFERTPPSYPQGQSGDVSVRWET
jgi:hypothetical protein